MLEKQIEAKVCDYAKTKNVLVYKFTSPNRMAVCDRIFISSTGKVFFIEFKQPGKEPTVLQKRHHQELAARNVAVYVINSIDFGKEVVDYESQSNWTRHHWSAIRYTGGNSVN